MADSDGEYVEDMSDDELVGNRGTSAVDSSYGTRSKGGRGKEKGDSKKGKGGGKKAWEDIQRSWEEVVEAADGSLISGASLEAEKRRRLLKDTTPVQRGIIRHLMLVLDMSFSMAEKDLLPNRYRLSLDYAIDFVREYFEQNPISQLGIVGMRDGIAVRISDMSGDPTDHIEKLEGWREKEEPQGNSSLQNALEMCRGALFHTPTHGTREVLIVHGSRFSSDPGEIDDTITNLISDRIRVSVIGLSAQVALCAVICSRTNGGETGSYNIALHEQNFRELLLAATTPPVTHASEQKNASLIMMGFPSRTVASADHISLCACHHRPTREGYACTRCNTKVCRLPSECPVCGLTLVLSTHLARSYHHLFPLLTWVEVSWAEAVKSVACFSCQNPFPPIPKGKAKEKSKAIASTIPALPEVKGVSESGRYACPACGQHFCIECDVYSHEILHNCPGCQSNNRGQTAVEANGTAMEVDS
ncbi:putative tfiih basal transcription factor complex p47 subunit protein [Podospora aff. communis PSN243]|uniref:General transcription and DNA repair factor IIH n=1 Tax=Podospora aff. communis PSN243 TaxID=3040156 RepID=A0AAV9H441_9PEZI|nr:putative tfiih basal transcription factor complex p47 subunit protein [Podospora aff. communis PSN243]